MRKTAAVSERRPPSAGLAGLENHAAAAARLLKLMASEPRLMLLCRLGDGECSVGDLAMHAKLTQSAASQHLSRLRAEGVVTTRREGQTIYYQLADPDAALVIETLCGIFRNRDGGDHAPASRRSRER